MHDSVFDQGLQQQLRYVEIGQRLLVLQLTGHVVAEAQRLKVTIPLQEEELSPDGNQLLAAQDVPQQPAQRDDGPFQGATLTEPVQAQKPIQRVVEKVRLDLRLERTILRVALIQRHDIFALDHVVQLCHHRVECVTQQRDLIRASDDEARL